MCRGRKPASLPCIRHLVAVVHLDCLLEHFVPGILDMLLEGSGLAVEAGSIVHLGCDLGCGSLLLSYNHALDLLLDVRPVVGVRVVRKEGGALSGSLVECVAGAVELLLLLPVDLWLALLDHLWGEDRGEIGYCRAMLDESRMRLQRAGLRSSRCTGVMQLDVGDA